MTQNAYAMPSVGETVRFRASSGLRGSCVIVDVSDGSLVARFSGDSPVPDTRIELVYQEDGQPGVLCCVAVGRGEGMGPGAVLLAVQRRQSYRVSCPPGSCAVAVAGHTGVSVIDLSLDGIAVRTHRAMEEGERVEAAVGRNGSTARGVFTVRNVRPVRQGFIAGLEIEGDHPALREWMRVHAMELQREELARTGRAVSNPGAAQKRASAAADPEPAPDAAEEAGPPDEETGSSPKDAAQTSKAGSPHRARSRGTDRRAHERSALLVRGVASTIEEDDKRRFNVETVNISRGGVGLRSAMPIDIGRRVMVVLSRTGTSPWVLGRVVSCSAEPGVNGYRVGVRFIQSTFQNWPAPDPGSLMRVASDIERTKPGSSGRGRSYGNRSTRGMSWG